MPRSTRLLRPIVRPVAIAGLAALMLAFALTSGGESTYANPADVLGGGFDCYLVDGAGDPLFVSGGGVVNVDTNGADTGTIACAADGVANDTGRAQRFNYANTGFGCYVIGAGSTRSWHAVVSADGHATLTCHVGK